MLNSGRRKTVPIIIGCALFMELIDATAVLTALPQMALDFTEPSVRMNLVISLYLLVVAHRLSTVAHLDRILVFDNGREIEEGSHEQRLGLRGQYYRLSNRQFDEVIGSEQV